MNRRVDNEQLLADVLSEAAPAYIRDAMLGETLRWVRRRRRWRQARRAATALAVLGLFAIFVWQKNLLRRPVAPAPVANAVGKNYHLVQSRPLPTSAIVSTRSLASGQLITSAETIEIVQTGGGKYRVINDDELLALVGRRPALLIRIGPHAEELVFANPEDQKGFPLN